MSLWFKFNFFLRKFRRRLSEESITDSERIRILQTSPQPSTRGEVNYSVDQSHHVENQPQCSTFNTNEHNANELSPDRKGFKSQPKNFLNADNSFYNMGFSMSPSDFERHSKHRNSMSGSLTDPGLRISKSECKIFINRHAIDNSYIDKKYGSKQTESPYKKASRYIQTHCVCNLAWFLSFFTSLIPVTFWLPKYKKEFLISDFIAGFTVAIMHIPQGMAYGVLASLNAENGLYVSFFPVLIYFLLGTSKHISIGTFAVISLLVSSAVYGFNSNINHDFNSTDHNSSSPSMQQISGRNPTHVEIGTALAIAVGIWQVLLGTCHLGSLAVVLSDQLVSGFTSGAACHVAVSQMKDLFGIHIGRYSGAFKLIYMLRDIIENLVHTNVAAVVISAVAIFIISFFKEQIDKRLKGRLKMPIPIDLIVVVLATISSYFGRFKEYYEVNVIEDIPTGLPYPTTPRLDLIPKLISDSFAIAIVAFAVSLSMAKLLAKKQKYSVRANQELLALGSANIFSSFFSCYPCSASLSRSLVQESSGGKTQVTGLVSCGLLLVVLLYLAPMFYSLPKCILSCIILVALKPMFLQVRDFFKTWRISQLDALIWLVTFISTVLLDVTYGLLVGVLFSLVTVIIRTVIPSKTFLGRIPDTDIYLDSRRYDLAQEIKGIKIFHFESALYFINKDIFKSSLLKHIPLYSDDENKESVKDSIYRIIIDCSTFTFIDVSGLEMILEIMKEYNDVGISVFLSGCSISMQGVMERAKFNEKIPQHPSVFPTIHDAVEFQFCSQK